jgi:RNA polymerase sigma-70 factor (ECF subfamily)
MERTHERGNGIEAQSPEANRAAPPSPITVEQVFRDYAPRIYHVARRMLGNDADAEDVTQDVLLQVVRKLDSFRGESALSTWLHRVTVNAALAHRQKRARGEEKRVRDPLDHFLENGTHAAPVRHWSVAPEEEIQNRETRELIDKAITELPENYRDVYVLAVLSATFSQNI